MAEAKKENKTWKEIYREKVNQIREWSVKPDNWFVRLAPYILVAILSALIARLWWYKLTYPGRCLDIDDIFVEGIEGSLVINILLMIGCLYSTALLFLYTYFNKPRYWHLPIYAIVAAFICTIPKWHPVETAIPGLYYSCFITICLVSILIGELLSLILGYITRDTLIALSSGEHGFVTKTEEKELIDTGWKGYINTIFDLVGEKQLAEESFAIGIAGSWGSGKTTFYDAVKSKIKDDHRFVLCEFKPWQILDPQRIAPEFFAILADALQNSKDGRHTHLRDDLKKYAQLLTEVPEIPDYAKLFTSVVGANEDKSIPAMRDQIDKHLKNSYIIVLIDDLDRLNREELLEILRLVRASANFKHVLFLLTYDKGYFDSVLDKENGSEYLKKIINVEISLPPIEQYKYGELLYQSITSIFNEEITVIEETKKMIRSILSTLDRIISMENAKAENSLLYRYLQNFRDIKRFANQYGLVMRHIAESGKLIHYDMPELFWLEVLHYTDNGTYTALKNNYTTFLFQSETKDGQERLQVKEEYRLQPKYSLLWSLFSERRTDAPKNSIIWTNNYYSYFAHRQLENYVSTTAFSLWMNHKDSEEVCIKIIEWLKDDNKRNSVFQLLKDYPLHLKFDSQKEAENYTNVLLRILSLAQQTSTKQLIIEQFKHKYHRSYFTQIADFNPSFLIRKYIENSPNGIWNRVLSAMCFADSDETMELLSFDNTSIDIEYIITHTELEELAKLNYLRYFKKKDMPYSALFNIHSQYMQFVSEAAYIGEVKGYGPRHTENYTNLLGDYLVERFIAKANKGKSTDTTFTMIYNNLLEYAGVDIENDEKGGPLKMQEAIARTLGSMKNFEIILKECFNLSKKNQFLCEQIGLNMDDKK